MLKQLTLASLTIALLAGCGGPSGRIRGENEASLVGDRRAGAPVYRGLADKCLKELSEKYRAETRGQETFQRIKMAFVGVENATKEELGSWRDQVNAIIDERINFSGDFMDLSFENFIQPAMKEAGVSTRQLAIPAHQRKLASVLEQQGKPVEYFLFAKLTQGDTTSGDLRQSDYVMVFELVNLANGTRLMAKGEISKEYVRP